MNEKQLEQLKANYADWIVEGLDMDSVITIAAESIENNLQDWTEDEIKEEIVDHYGEETLKSLLSE
jgi:hypothetical protein